jgi:ribosomal-protein-alanine N-acetyltransferase
MELGDASNMYLMRSDTEVMQYLDRPMASSVAEMEAKIKQINLDMENGDCIQWTICHKNDPQLIGTICIWNIDKKNYRGEIGYMLMKENHRQGLIMEAIKLVIDFGFNKMKLHSIEGQVTPKNIPSIKVLERNGFVREAYYRENYFWQGTFIDTAVYSLINKN